MGKSNLTTIPALHESLKRRVNEAIKRSVENPIPFTLTQEDFDTYREWIKYSVKLSEENSKAPND